MNIAKELPHESDSPDQFDAYYNHLIVAGSNPGAHLGSWHH